MKNRIKFIFTRLTLLTLPLSLIVSILYLKLDYSFNKSLQLGTLISIGTVLTTGLFFTVVYILIYPILVSIDNKRQIQPNRKRRKKKKSAHSQFMTNNTIKDTQKNKEEQLPNKSETDLSIAPEKPNKKSETRSEIKVAKNQDIEEKRSHEPVLEREGIQELSGKLEELSQTQGEFDEIMLILPENLIFLLAKESIKNFFFGKITASDSQAGTVAGTVGFGSTPHILKLTVKSTTSHSVTVEIFSKSSKHRQSRKKNRRYIKKISKFLKKKEETYSSN